MNGVRVDGQGSDGNVTRSGGVPDRPPLPPTRARRRAVIARTYAVLVVFAVAGAVVYALTSAEPGQAVSSFLVAAIGVVVILEVGMYNVRAGNRISPAIGFAAAIFSYGLTVLLLGIVLAAASPRVVDAAAVAVGLIAALVIWTVGLVARSWVA